MSEPTSDNWEQKSTLMVLGLVVGAALVFFLFKGVHAYSTSNDDELLNTIVSRCQAWVKQQTEHPNLAKFATQIEGTVENRFIAGKVDVWDVYGAQAHRYACRFDAAGEISDTSLIRID